MYVETETSSFAKGHILKIENIVQAPCLILILFTHTNSFRKEEKWCSDKLCNLPQVAHRTNGIDKIRMESDPQVKILTTVLYEIYIIFVMNKLTCCQWTIQI